MRREFVLYICIGLSIPISAYSKNGDWKVLNSASESDLKNHHPIQVKILEDQSVQLDSNLVVGNTGIPANPRPRKLVVEAPGAGVWEFAMPEQTRSGDECSIVDVSGLSVTGPLVTISLDYQFACGAGSGTVVTHRFMVSGNSLRLASMQLKAASRDGIGLTKIDFKKGERIDRFDRPEDSKPQRTRKSRFKPYVVTIEPNVLVRCPFPLRGSEMPDCLD